MPQVGGHTAQHLEIAPNRAVVAQGIATEGCHGLRPRKGTEIGKRFAIESEALPSLRILCSGEIHAEYQNTFGEYASAEPVIWRKPLISRAAPTTKTAQVAVALVL